MPLLQLPTSSELRLKSVEMLRQVGVQVVRLSDGYGLSFSSGVGQVVACVLEAETKFAADIGARDQLRRAIASAEKRLI